MFNKVDVSMSMRDLAEVNVVRRHGCKPLAPGMAALAALVGIGQGLPWIMIFLDTIASFFRMRILARNHELFTVFGWTGLLCAVGAWLMVHFLESRWHERVFDEEKMLENQWNRATESSH